MKVQIGVILHALVPRQASLSASDWCLQKGEITRLWSCCAQSTPFWVIYCLRCSLPDSISVQFHVSSPACAFNSREPATNPQGYQGMRWKVSMLKSRMLIQSPRRTMGSTFHAGPAFIQRLTPPTGRSSKGPVFRGSRIYDG